MPQRIEIDPARLRALIEAGKTSTEIAVVFGVTYPTVLRRAEEHGLREQLSANGTHRRHNSQYKDGRGTYRRHKKGYCEDCGATGVRLEVHHKTPVRYNETWSVIIEGDHRPENLVTLCNGCHQRRHYREHGRAPMVSDGRRFYGRKHDKTMAEQ